MCDKRAYIIITEGAPDSVIVQVDEFLKKNGIKGLVLNRSITIHEVNG